MLEITRLAMGKKNSSQKALKSRDWDAARWNLQRIIINQRPKIERINPHPTQQASLQNRTMRLPPPPPPPSFDHALRVLPTSCKSSPLFSHPSPAPPPADQLPSRGGIKRTCIIYKSGLWDHKSPSVAVSFGRPTTPPKKAIVQPERSMSHDKNNQKPIF